MAAAEVGDDVYGEDPTVNRLEATAAEHLGKEAALFVSSGTQANLLAIMSHCGRGDEYIAGQTAHNYQLEGGGAAVLGGIQPQPVPFADNGELPVADIRAAIKPDDPHFARTRLVSVENTQNGRPLAISYLNEVAALCREKHLALHMDGARLFNAAVSLQASAAEIVAGADSVSICLSKGLGAPVGSLLVGSGAYIAEARRLRKMLGGGMRQAGVVAAAGLHALERNVERLAEDHTHAEAIAAALETRYPGRVQQATNMIFVDLPGAQLKALVQHLQAHDVRISRERMVLHKDVHADDVGTVISAIESL